MILFNRLISLVVHQYQILDHKESFADEKVVRFGSSIANVPDMSTLELLWSLHISTSIPLRREKMSVVSNFGCTYRTNQSIGLMSLPSVSQRELRMVHQVPISAVHFASILILGSYA